MMGAPDLFKEIIGLFPESAPIADVNALVAKALVKAGLGVVLCQPGGKKPACTLGAAQSRKADLEAQAAAEAAGVARWDKVRHDCGKKHVITDPKELTRAHVRDLLANGANLAIMPGAGTRRLIVVDLDTTAQREAFLAAWASAEGREFVEPMTVTSPGVMRAEADGTENWIHKNGGHYWFSVPDGVELPESVSKYEGDGGWVVYIRDAYALIPPSVRPEGRYRLRGHVYPAPSWLLDAIQAKAVEEETKKAERAQRMAEGGPGDIDDWATETSWGELLVSAGWSASGAYESCGCPIWTRPGNPSHPKSATAHEVGCARFDTSTGWGPIHAWSDEVRWGGQATVSKLDFLAWTHHDGDRAEAIRAIGLDPASVSLPELEPFDPFEEDDAPSSPAVSVPAQAPPMFADPAPVEALDGPVSVQPATTAEDAPTAAQMKAAILRLADQINTLKERARGGAAFRTYEELKEERKKFHRADRDAKRELDQETGLTTDYTDSARALSGADWLSAQDEEIEPIWGTSELPLWAPGESLMLVGPPSVGKSTLAHLLIWGVLGLAQDTLGFPVKPETGGGVLYLAMDRPAQIRRAMRRLFNASQLPHTEVLQTLRERLTVWEGPLPVDITVPENRRYLVAMAQHYGRTTIVVDSTKDVLPNASDEAKAGGYNLARQEALAEGLNWLELHHNRKSNGESKEPNTLDDVYGSRWLTAGAGSVLSLFGQPGDIVVKLTHVKPLGEPLFPKNVHLDRGSGVMSLYEELTPERAVIQAGPAGAPIKDLAALLFDTKAPTKSQVENTRNKINRLIKEGKAVEVQGNPTRYRAATAGTPLELSPGRDPFSSE